MYTQEYARQIAQTALNQLGGHAFIVCVGAKNICYDSRNLSLQLDFCKNKSKANRLRITYVESSDLYKVEFIKRAIQPRSVNGILASMSDLTKYQSQTLKT